MTDEEFEDADDDALDTEDLDEEDLEDDALDDDLDDDVEVIDLDAALDVDTIPVATVETEDVEEAAPKARRATPKGEDDDEEDGLDLDEEAHPDDVEVPLDALLKERTASATLEDEEEEVEEEEVELDPGEGPTKIMPRRADEFLCSSCFLVLPRNQLSDEARMLCRDCA